MKVNPFAPTVPCHRVVASNGAIGGFFGQTEGVEIQRKIKLLASEGVVVEGNEIKEFENVKYEFK